MHIRSPGKLGFSLLCEFAAQQPIEIGVCLTLAFQVVSLFSAVGLQPIIAMAYEPKISGKTK